MTYNILNLSSLINDNSFSNWISETWLISVIASCLLAATRSLRKDPDAGKDWGKEEKGATEDEMVGWHHQFSGYEFEQTRDREGQGSLLLLSHFSPVRLLATPWITAYQGPPCMGFSRQDYWRGLPLSSLQGSLVCCNSWDCKELDTT